MYLVGVALHSYANEVPSSPPFLAFNESTTSRNTSRAKNSGQREFGIESSGMRQKTGSIRCVPVDGQAGLDSHGSIAT
jgi:hypothetical protein